MLWLDLTQMGDTVFLLLLMIYHGPRPSSCHRTSKVEKNMGLSLACNICLGMGGQGAAILVMSLQDSSYCCKAAAGAFSGLSVLGLCKDSVHMKLG